MSHEPGSSTNRSATNTSSSAITARRSLTVSAPLGEALVAGTTSADPQHVVDRAAIAAAQQIRGLAQRDRRTRPGVARNGVVDGDPVGARVFARQPHHAVVNDAGERDRESDEIHGVQIKWLHGHVVQAGNHQSRFLGHFAYGRILGAFARLNVAVYGFPCTRTARVGRSLEYQ